MEGCKRAMKFAIHADIDETATTLARIAVFVISAGLKISKNRLFGTISAH